MLICIRLLTTCTLLPQCVRFRREKTQNASQNNRTVSYFTERKPKMPRKITEQCHISKMENSAQSTKHCSRVYPLCAYRFVWDKSNALRVLFRSSNQLTYIAKSSMERMSVFLCKIVQYGYDQQQLLSGPSSAACTLYSDYIKT